MDTSHHTSPMRYTQTSNYEVNIRALYLRKSASVGQKQGRNLNDYRKIALPAEYASSSSSHIVDSGTTITYFSPKLATGFKKEWKSLTGFDYIDDPESSFPFTDKQLSKFPTVLIQIEALNDGCDESKTTGESESDTSILRRLDRSHCNDIILSFPPSHYLYKDEDGKYSINISFEDLVVANGILGANIIL